MYQYHSNYPHRRLKLMDPVLAAGSGKTFLRYFLGRLSILSCWGKPIEPKILTIACSSMVIDNLLENAMERYGVAYIYFQHDKQDQQRPVDVFSSLIKQLLCQIPNIPAEIEQLYDKLKHQQKQPTVGDLRAALMALTKSFSRTFIICDALDECNQEARRREFLPFFKQMAHEAGMNLFLTSREHPEDIHHFLNGSALKIRILANEEDIACYIEQKIDENTRAKRFVQQAQCKDRIISCLTDCAKGM